MTRAKVVREAELQEMIMLAQEESICQQEVLRDMMTREVKGSVNGQNPQGMGISHALSMAISNLASYSPYASYDNGESIINAQSSWSLVGQWE